MDVSKYKEKNEERDCLSIMAYWCNVAIIAKCKEQ